MRELAQDEQKSVSGGSTLNESTHMDLPPAYLKIYKARQAIDSLIKSVFGEKK